jgi:hypothetical protein
MNDQIQMTNDEARSSRVSVDWGASGSGGDQPVRLGSSPRRRVGANMAPRVLVAIRGCRQPQAGSPFDFAQGRPCAPRTSSPRYMRILPVTGRSGRVA